MIVQQKARGSRKTGRNGEGDARLGGAEIK